jgi:hypothetical protein
MSKKLFISLALLAGATVSLSAQSFQEGFFLRDSRMSYRYNPALAPENGFIGAGRLLTQDYRSYGLSTFIYPQEDGKLATFLHPSVSADEFGSRIQPDNYILKTLDYNVLAYGLRRGAAMHTFELNLRGSLGISLPGEPFQLLKNGTTVSDLQLGHLRGEVDLYLELAYGYSRRISDNLSVGGRVKLLAGMYAVDYNATHLQLTMDEQHIQANIQAQLNLTDKLIKFSAGNDGYLDWGTFVWKGLGNIPSGGGVAMDLGISYMPVDGLELSASVLDLGGILWYYGNAAASSGDVDFTGFQDLTYDQMNMDGITAQFSQLKDDALHSLKLIPSKSKWAWKGVPFSANAAVKYALPFYDRLSLGITGNYASYQWMPYWETRFGAGLQPLDWLEMTANLGTGAFGMVWGLAGSVRVHPFHFTVGLGNGFGGITPESRRPIKANNKTFSFGIVYEL